MTTRRIIDKVFLFNPYACHLTDGGPSGVIAQNLLGHDLRHVYVNPVVDAITQLRDILRKKIFPPPVHGFYRDWFLKCEKIYRGFGVARYRAVLFHDVFSMWCCLHLLPPDQRVLLQSHSPELPHQEVAASSFATDDLVRWVRTMESDAFCRADCVVFPNEDVVDIYRPLLCDRSTIAYLPTGARRVDDNDCVGLDPSLCNLLFIGRRNRIKGFDLLVDAFRQAHKSRPALRLYLLGRGDPVEEPGVVDLGYSEKPHIWMRSCDYMINYNRQSYFDLSLLEALSVGARVILSTTNGHREFLGAGSDGIITVEQPTVDRLVNILLSEELVRYNTDRPLRDNIDLYMRRYTDGIYRENLDALASSLLCEIR